MCVYASLWWSASLYYIYHIQCDIVYEHLTL